MLLNNLSFWMPLRNPWTVATVTLGFPAPSFYSWTLLQCDFRVEMWKRMGMFASDVVNQSERSLGFVSFQPKPEEVMKSL